MSSAPVGRWLLIAAAIAVVAAVAAAILVMGSPAAQRERSLDMRRVHDLQRIENAVDRHYLDTGRLPADLATLTRQPGVALTVADPVTASPYAYEAGDGRNYRLCAVFTTDTAIDTEDAALPSQTRWAHGSGRHCYDLRSEARKPD